MCHIVSINRLFRRFQLVEKVRFLFCASCDSTHKIEFAQQIHKNRGRVPRFLYKGRKNVSGGRGFSSAFDRKRGFDREAARKTIVFRQPPTVFSDGFYFFAARDGRMYPSFFCHKMQKTTPKGGLLTDFDFICYNRNGQVHIAVRPSFLSRCLRQEGGGANAEKGISAFRMCSNPAVHLLYKSAMTARLNPERSSK